MPWHPRHTQGRQACGTPAFSRNFHETFNFQHWSDKIGELTFRIIYQNCFQPIVEWQTDHPCKYLLFPPNFHRVILTKWRLSFTSCPYSKLRKKYFRIYFNPLFIEAKTDHPCKCFLFFFPHFSQIHTGHNGGCQHKLSEFKRHCVSLVIA